MPKTISGRFHFDDSNAQIILKPSRDHSILNRHPWIFSGAIMQVNGSPQAGEIVTIHDTNRQILGHGFYNPHSQIRVRMLNFSHEQITEQFFIDRITAAAALRTHLLSSEINAIRLVNGEGDGLPGLVVDRYGSALVMQLHSLGMTRLRPKLINWLKSIFSPITVIIEHSPESKEEGISSVLEVIWGKIPFSTTMPFDDNHAFLEIMEHGVRSWVDVLSGQKTGMFLDQRENRQRIGQFSAMAHKGAQLLNCFSYTGGFSLHAALHGLITTSVEISAPAQDLARKNFILNNLDPKLHRFETADVLDWLRNCDEHYDLVVLDPPAFVKHRPHLERGARAYKDINRLALRLLKKHGLLMTCSCSSHVDWSLFQKILYSAAREANRHVQILARYSQPTDHPFDIFHPEGEYLKTFVLRVAY